MKELREQIEQLTGLDISKRTRDADHSVARHVYFYLCRFKLKEHIRTVDIGASIGFNHTSVSYGTSAVMNRHYENNKNSKKINNLLNQLT